jgi:hypothetical protein
MPTIHLGHHWLAHFELDQPLGLVTHSKRWGARDSTAQGGGAGQIPAEAGGYGAV